MKKYTTLIFDMDGTLFDTETISMNAWIKAGEYFNLPISKEFCLQLIGRTKQSAKPIFDKYMPQDWNEEEVLAYRSKLAQEFKEKHGPLPKCDLINLLNTLKKKGYKLAICSSSHRSVIDFNLSYVHIEDYFDVICDGSLVEKGKPAPDIYLHCVEMLKEEKENCLVIEDSKNGILSAYNAGIDVIMVKDLVEADEKMKKCSLTILDSLEEILNIV